MRCVLNRVELLKAVDLLSIVITDMATRLPLRCVKIEVFRNSHVIISGANIVANSALVAIKMPDDSVSGILVCGYIMVNARQLTEILRNSESGHIHFDNFHITDDDSSIDMANYNSTTFPSVGIIISKCLVITIAKLKNFQDGLKLVLPVIARKPKRKIDDKIYIEGRKGYKTLTLVRRQATRVAISKVKLMEKTSENIKTRLSVTAANLIAQIDNPAAEIRIAKSRDYDVFIIDNVIVFNGKTSNAYLAYDDRIPKGGTMIKMPTKKTFKIVKKIPPNPRGEIGISLGDDDDVRAVRFNSPAGQSFVKVNYNGEPIPNYRFSKIHLIDALKVIKSKELTLELYPRIIVIRDGRSYCHVLTN